MKRALTLILILFSALPAAFALPKAGTPAPPLRLTQLLQARPGAQADWNALHGKVVVLEFWATWCEVCVAELPQFNKLVASLDPKRFQFISVDDEDPAIVEAFLTKREIAGWVGIDTTGEVFRRFGVGPRPTTVIVDAQGKIVAVTHPEKLKAVDLMAVARRKSAKFEPLEERPRDRAMQATAVKPLYQISLTKAVPDGKGASMSSGGGQMDMYGWSAEALLSMAYNSIPRDRLISLSPLPDGVFDLHAVWASGEDNTLLIAPFLQNAISFGLNLQVQWKTVTKRAYVLKKGEAGSKLLTPTAMTNKSYMRSYSNGKMRMVNGSMDDLTVAMEEGLEIPVVNETEIKGKFDAELEFPARDAAAAQAALLNTLGLELHQEDRPITLLEIRKREDLTKSAKTNLN
jgi:uncharacterized protein (TIGR03435 family)